MTGVAMKITYTFRKDIAEKINHMPLRYFDGTSHGEVLSRVTNDVDTVSQTLKSEPDADHYFCDNAPGYFSDDVYHQLADDPGGFGHPPAVVWYPWPDHEQIAGLLQTPAGLPGSHQWSCRRNVRGACCGESL